MSGAVYNARKLSEYRERFVGRRVLVVGAGAVGTYEMEYLAKMGLSPDAVDMDRFTLENAAKHSGLIRTPEDVGRNKAVCTAERVQPLLDEGCSSNGIDTDLCHLGPEAFADYEYVVLALDNYDAKVLAGELIRQLPPGRRPIVLMAGTYDEMAQSVILDNQEFCLRCLISEDWMKDSSIRTSCSGPQIRQIEGRAEIVRTTNLASSMAAHLSAEQIRGSILGLEGVMNRRLTYSAYPQLDLSVSHPMVKRDCPGCAVHTPEEIRWLYGSVLEVTLREALEQIAEALGTREFELSVHRLNYRKVVYGGFIVSSRCRCCGKEISVMRHEGRVYAEDLRCRDCAAQGRPVPAGGEFDARVLRAFSWESEPAVQERSLYALGYPLGAHLEVIERHGALDLLDEEKVTRTIFALEEDHQRMHEIHRLD